MRESNRDSFGNSFGVLVALAGSAVGLGNIWRFPYLVGENGGAAFIILYVIFALFLSLPIMFCEFVIGRRSQVNAVSSFSKLHPGGHWNLVGFLGVLSAFVITSFYCVIGGWGVKYFLKALLFEFKADAAIDYSQMFVNTASSVWPPIIYMAIFFLISAAIVSSGVKNGIEKCSKIMMPVLFILMIAIAVCSMLLPGANVGIRYIFRPDFSVVTGKTVIAAMGQAFFSLSLGMGIVLTYASYVKRDENIIRSSLLTISFDTLFALIASCAIMPAVFAFGFEPSAGPGLVFITLPKLFSQMPAGGIAAIVFFFAFLLAAMTSAISLLEVVVAFVVERFNCSRKKAVAVLSIIFLSVASLNSLSQGVLSDIKIFGMNILDFFDYISANFMMTIGAFFIVIFVGWKLGKEAFQDELTNGGSLNIPQKFVDSIFVIIKYIAPLVIFAIVACSL